MNVGERIKYYRSIKGVSARALAIEIGLDPSQISKIENNVSNTTIETLSNICTALGITLADFFSEGKKDIPPDLMQLLEEAKSITPEQRKILTDLIQSFKK